MKNHALLKPRRRFYTRISIDNNRDGDFFFLLDEKILHTPSGVLLSVPVRALACLIMDEFNHQTEMVIPLTMPVFRLACCSLDLVSSQPSTFKEEVMKFLSSDMICYRADSPESLVKTQSLSWDPVLGWFFEKFQARFLLSYGVSYVEQPSSSLAKMKRLLELNYHPLCLAAFHLSTVLSGSALLSFALAYGHLSSDETWRLAHVDEDWQAQHWGEGQEALVQREFNQRDFFAAASVLNSFSFSL